MSRAELHIRAFFILPPLRAGLQLGHCPKVEETTPLEPGVKEYKYYARGIGLIQDGDLKLVKSGKADKPK